MDAELCPFFPLLPHLSNNVLADCGVPFYLMCNYSRKCTIVFELDCVVVFEFSGPAVHGFVSAAHMKDRLRRSLTSPSLSIPQLDRVKLTNSHGTEIGTDILRATIPKFWGFIHFALKTDDYEPTGGS
jgi:hypothetical protein